MKNKVRLPGCVALLLSSTLLNGDALAHQGAGEPLFVAENGRDAGRCLDEAAPCRTLGYALSVAGKGAEIRMAQGSYEIDDSRDLFHVVSGMIEVSGGFERRGERFGRRTGVSTLAGVPPEFRDELGKRGFHVVSDRKSIGRNDRAQTEKLVALHAALKSGAPAAPCTAGKAGELDCTAVDLLSHFSFADVSAAPGSATDVWGFVDLNTGREYAIVGYDIGTAVVDVSDPESPREVGFIDGQPAFWRDIKTYQFFDEADSRWRSYAYVTTDGSTDGLFVIDLGGLPHSIAKVDYASDFFAAHNVYATNTDYGTGVALTGEPPLLAISGSNLSGGGYRGYTLQDPAAPEFVAGAGGVDYMHDATSVILTDARKDTQCENGGAWCEVLIDFNESTVDVWDITEASAPRRLSRTPYANAAYVHSGWWAEDRQHVFVHDELDEQNLSLNTTVRVFSLADLDTPVQVGEWTGPSRAIDHNGFVRGNRYYVSNYAKGLTVLDITDPAAPVAVGSLDTYPFSDNSAFVGAWGAYPFFWSGTVAVSDIDTGLYLARDRSIEVPQGRFAFDATSYAAEEGQSAVVIVRRIGGSSGQVSVGYEAVPATADAADYQLVAGTLDWPAGDAGTRTIPIPLANDGHDEGLERLLLRLVNPSGGAALDHRNVASVYVSEPAAAATLAFFQEQVATTERGFATAVLVVQRLGSGLGAVSVDYEVTGGDATAGEDFTGATSGTLSWADGDANAKSIVFSINDDDDAEDTETFGVTLSNVLGATLAGAATATVEIANGRGFNSAPNAIAGGSRTVTGGSRVTLDGGQSNDPDGDSLGYQWEQTSGPQVTLDDPSGAVTAFTAPAVASDTMLQFRLTVTDPSGLSDSSSTTITVVTADPGGSGGGSTSLPFLVGGAAALSRRRKDAAARSSVRGRGPSK